ncbi:GTPase IMAP family member 8-like [Cyprinodon tularosa]|uniref:GTPase IMAP family member 8-like n=1 Tax=Cyprinodon tularosa TaxID=77115 RepID=UPI0018E286D9|nr:GTPase IMAP family member 8-like [Cyprinodon tularosa]
MSCCCGSKLKIVVIGSDGAERNEVINLIQNHLKSNQTSFNLSCLPIEEVYPESYEGLDMDHFNRLGQPDYDSKEMEIKKITRCISKTAHHVFLLVIKNGQSKEEIKAMVENIKAVFGEKVTKSMILVLKGEALGNEGISTIEDINKEDKLKFIRCLKVCNHQESQSAVSEIVNEIQEIISESGGKCYTHKMMMMMMMMKAQSSAKKEKQELRIVVIGSNNAKKKEVIDMIWKHLQQSNNPHRTRSCCLKSKGYPVSYKGRDMFIFNPPGLYASKCNGDKMKEIKRCISKTASHLFLLVIENEPSKKKIKEMLEDIKFTFGQTVTENMVLVINGYSAEDGGGSIIDAINAEEELKNRCVNVQGQNPEPAADIMDKVEEIINACPCCYTYDEMMEARRLAEKEKQELRIVVIGSIDAGKKEVIDMIQNHPRITDKPNETKVNICCSKPQTESYAVRYERRDMILFDPPGLCDPNCNGDEMEEIRRCISKNARHVFLLVLDVNFTEENKEMLEKIESTFGENIQENMIIVFKLTQPCDEPQIDIIKRELFDLMKFLYDFAVKCERRCVDVVENFNNESAVKQIMDEINKIITISEGECYTYKMLKTVQKKEEKTKKLPIKAKIGLLVGLWVGALLGLIFFGKDFLQTGCVLGGGSGAIMGMVVPAAKERLLAIKARI